jgi:hypothetical protein
MSQKSDEDSLRTDSLLKDDIEENKDKNEVQISNENSKLKPNKQEKIK